MAVLQEPVQCCSQAARFMKDKAKALEGGGDGEDRPHARSQLLGQC